MKLLKELKDSYNKSKKWIYRLQSGINRGRYVNTNLYGKYIKDLLFLDGTSEISIGISVNLFHWWLEGRHCTSTLRKILFIEICVDQVILCTSQGVVRLPVPITFSMKNFLSVVKHVAVRIQYSNTLLVSEQPPVSEVGVLITNRATPFNQNLPTITKSSIMSSTVVHICVENEVVLAEHDSDVSSCCSSSEICQQKNRNLSCDYQLGIPHLSITTEDSTCRYSAKDSPSSSSSCVTVSTETVDVVCNQRLHSEDSLKGDSVVDTPRSVQQLLSTSTAMVVTSNGSHKVLEEHNNKKSRILITNNVVPEEIKPHPESGPVRMEYSNDLHIPVSDEIPQPEDVQLERSNSLKGSSDSLADYPPSISLVEENKAEVEGDKERCSVNVPVEVAVEGGDKERCSVNVPVEVAVEGGDKERCSVNVPVEIAATNFHPVTQSTCVAATTVSSENDINCYNLISNNLISNNLLTTTHSSTTNSRTSSEIGGHPSVGLLSSHHTVVTDVETPVWESEPLQVPIGGTHYERLRFWEIKTLLARHSKESQWKSPQR